MFRIRPCVALVYNYRTRFRTGNRSRTRTDVLPVFRTCPATIRGLERRCNFFTHDALATHTAVVTNRQPYSVHVRKRAHGLPCVVGGRHRNRAFAIDRAPLRMPPHVRKPNHKPPDTVVHTAYSAPVHFCFPKKLNLIAIKSFIVSLEINAHGRFCITGVQTTTTLLARSFVARVKIYFRFLIPRFRSHGRFNEYTRRLSPTLHTTYVYIFLCPYTYRNARK